MCKLSCHAARAPPAIYATTDRDSGLQLCLNTEFMWYRYYFVQKSMRLLLPLLQNFNYLIQVLLFLLPRQLGGV